jgi:hypothetical protein
MADEKKDLTGIHEIKDPSLTDNPAPGESSYESSVDVDFPALDAAPAAEGAAEAPGFEDPFAPNEPASGPERTSANEAAPRETLERVREFSENAPVGAPQVEAAFPFNLLITGPLAQEEKDRLLELVMRENLGVREMDLEPQFAGDRVLIPRISEYAGVLLVQALRGTHADIRLVPATRDPDDIFPVQTAIDSARTFVGDGHAAEQLPLTADSQLPDYARFVVLDAVTASVSLRASAVEAESSAEYQEALEGLQRELKYKAYRKGANAVLNFNVTLVPLSAPFRYRLTAIGSAVKYAPDSN